MIKPSLEIRIQHYANRIRTLWPLKNRKGMGYEDVRNSIDFSIKRIREYKARIVLFPEDE